jgi:dihydroorotase/N-acyl-D-amino-acid deacylase
MRILRGVFLLTWISWPLALSAAPGSELDLVLANGRVVDGSGAPWFRADVGIRGDRIIALGDLSRAAAGRRIDVQGRMVAPGFIDLLGQSELYVLIDNRVESKIRQGITTEITGEGRSVAPISQVALSQASAFLERYRLKIDWKDLNGYIKRFESTRSAINLGTFVGAAQVRIAVLGLGDVQPNAAQLSEMERLVEQAMKQGARGVSSALIYPPGSYAKTAELIALAKVAARYGGVYASHIRGEADTEIEAVEEALAIGREARIPVEIWHLKVAGTNNWGKMKELLARIERARVEGVDVAANMYPYDAARNGLSANIPDWAHAGGLDAMIARFKDPAQREKIKAELWHGGVGREVPEGILLASCVNPAVKKYMGKRLSEVAREMGKSPEDALLDLIELAHTRIDVVRFVMNEDDVRLGLKQPWVSLGIDDAGQAVDGPFAGERGHPRAFGSAARLLGHYARDLRLFSVEEAVRKMTSQPAQRLGLYDRGLLRPGMAADITVFDPATVRDRATYEDPLRYSEGIEYVIVNGRLVLDAGKMTSERPGRFMKHSPQ